MSAEQTLEQRVAALEAVVAALQRQIAMLSPNRKWPWNLPGPVTNDEVFQKMIEYGREFRYADRPPDDPEETQ